jgi:hypothetical protein
MIHDLNTLRHLKVRRTVSQTYVIALPFWPWRQKAAEQELDGFLNALRERYFCRLCCVNLDTDHSSVCELDCAERFSAFAPELDEGGWALMFFEEKEAPTGLAERISSGPVFPESGGDAPAMLEKFGARIVVWSYYDNAEWLLCSVDASDANRALPTA